MKFTQAVDMFVEDMRQQGRINSDRTERSYRSILSRHGEEIRNSDPRYVGREQVKRTLAHWKHPNSQRTARAIIVSFYDWTMEEGFRKDNPARQTRRPKPRPPQTYRLNRDEVVRMLAAARTTRERRVIYLGICAGLRLQELIGLQGRHFAREGLIWVSADIAKGQRERWVPVIPDLIAVVDDIRAHVEPDEYVLPAQRWRDPGVNRLREDKRRYPSSPQAIWRLVGKVGKQAGIPAHMRPHLLRHAYADHIARFAGVRNAQFLLGHAGIGTTETYLGKPTIDELAAAVEGFTFEAKSEHTFQGVPTMPAIPLKATTGIEPVDATARLAERFSESLRTLFSSPLLQAAAKEAECES